MRRSTVDSLTWTNEALAWLVLSTRVRLYPLSDSGFAVSTSDARSMLVVRPHGNRHPAGCPLQRRPEQAADLAHGWSCPIPHAFADGEAVSEGLAFSELALTYQQVDK
jgi:hypothetical protein